jgi:hypothetical protein
MRQFDEVKRRGSLPGRSQYPRLVTAVLVILAVDVLLIAVVAYLLLSSGSAPAGQLPDYEEGDAPTESIVATRIHTVPVPTDVAPSLMATNVRSTATPFPTAIPEVFFEGPTTYGTSVQGRPLTVYRLGTGPSKRMIIGGIHGGYEWNTVELVSQTLTHLQQNLELVPECVTLYIAPCANPDGYAKAFDLSGRTNANDVDLNRNWAYNHQPTATHGTRPVLAGEEAFSEPETASLSAFIVDNKIEWVIFYHSAMGKIFSGAERESCYTDELAEMMSQATGYPYDPAGIPGQITTGDAIDWLSREGIAGIEIELTNHHDIEWERNLAGVLAFLECTILTREPALPSVPVESYPGYVTYTVQAGDSLSTIANRYGVSEDEIMYLNNIVDRHKIYAGQELLIPVKER